MELAASCTCNPLALPPCRRGWVRVRPDARQAAVPNRLRLVSSAVALGPEGDGGSDDLTASFMKELEKRDMESAAATEAKHASEFDGNALLQVLLDRYDRSYDVTLVRREYLGKKIVAMNIMWAYAEQRSFQLTEEEHMNRLDYIAAALRQWGMVGYVKEQISSRKDRPRVGKAISILLDVDSKVADEWFA